MNTLQQQLARDPARYAPIIKALKLGEIRDLQQVEGSLAFYHGFSEVHFLALDAPEHLEQITFHDPIQVMLLIGNTALEEVKQKFDFHEDMVCYQGVMLRTEPFKLSGELDVRPLDASYGEEVQKRYSLNTNESLELMTAQGQLFGAFKDGEWVGFIGFHDEGSMGMLEIFPQYQRKGYGEYLEKWLVNYEMARGNIPFGHVIVDNARSLALQKKMGFTLYEQRVHWLW